MKVSNRASSARSAAVGRCIFGVEVIVRCLAMLPRQIRRNFLRSGVAEPFRIFFPLGLLLGAIGVALWPLYVWHAIDFYPAQAHVRLMIEGLMGSFIIGFLGTAGPRLLDARPLGRGWKFPCYLRCKF